MKFKICRYSQEALKGLFSFDRYSDEVIIEDKGHLLYFDRYLNELGVCTVVAEFEYIDHDYLEDYANYYVKCFTNYNRKCIRLHFFNFEFDEDYIDHILKKGFEGGAKRLNRGYLGFAVIKPLPNKIVGRTCFKTYPPESRRNFPITRDYSVSLFGIPLTVNSLAYQEQDSVAGACATSALWSIFNGTGVLFHHAIPSPVEITRHATENLPAENRNFPNEGLTLEQMAHAIRNVGLEPYHLGVSTPQSLKNTAYAYLRGKVPLIMIFDIVDTSEKINFLRGMHAVAITGYSIDETAQIPSMGDRFLSRANRIDKFYVHDDQVGPFAKMEFTGQSIQYAICKGGSIEKTGFPMVTYWGDSTGAIFRAVPLALLVPVYHKIRIPYETIQDIIIDFDCHVELLRNANFITLSKRLNWDVFLSQVNDFKKDILECSSTNEESKKRVLIEPMPKFLWRAIGHIDDSQVIELIFDATGIEQGNLFIKAVNRHPSFFNELVKLSKVDVISQIVRKTSVKDIFSWFSRK